MLISVGVSGLSRTRSLRSFDEDDIRFVPGPIEQQLAAVRGNIEITNRKTAAQRRELPLASGLEIAHPKLLVGHIPLQRHQRTVSAEKRDASRAATQDEFRQRIRAPIGRDGLQRKRGPHISTGVNQEAAGRGPDGIEREALDKKHRCASIDRQLEQRRLTVTISGDGDPLPVGGPGGRSAHVELLRDLSNAAAVLIHDVQSRDSASPYRKRELPAVRGNRRSSHDTAIATVPELRGVLSLTELPDAVSTRCRRAVQHVVRSESGRQAIRRRKRDANRPRLVDWASD